MSLSLALTGASSQIGYFLLPQLLAAGYTVTVYARSPMPAWVAGSVRLRWHEKGANGKFTAARDVKHFVSLGPLALARQCIAEMPSLQTVIAISTTSLLTKHNSDDSLERKHIQSIQQAEDDLVNYCQEKTIRLVVLRPTLIYGAGLDNNVCFAARILRQYGVFPVVHNANGLRQPVHAEDIASICMHLLDHKANGIFNLAGAKPISFHDMLLEIIRVIGKGRLLRLPLSVLTASLAAAHAMGKFRAMNSAMFKRQQQDLVFDDDPARRQINWSPREFALDKAMLEPPRK